MTTDRPPKINDAPGLRWRLLKGGWEARWLPRTDLVKRGYPKMAWKLWLGREPTERDMAFVVDACQRLQDEMLIWGRGGIPVLGGFDGTIAGLAQAYQTDPDSPYRLVQFKTRTNYDDLCKRLVREHGDELVANINARVVRRWHEDWTAKGHIATGHMLVRQLRTIIGFGVTYLENPDCQRLAGILHSMRIPMGKPRKERMTAEQAIAIRAMAHQKNRPSIALAQAIQFELMWRQKDVIGEWVPLSERGVSDIQDGHNKWIKGLRWSEIDASLNVKHTTSKRGKDYELDLHLAPMVMEELSLVAGLNLADGLTRTKLPAAGPVIICEKYGRPFYSYEFRRAWRKIAREAGVPDAVFNMDSRAGGITEASDAGADLEHIRHAATHSNISMTQRYSRGGTEKTAGVMKQRVEHRNKK